MIIAGVGGRKEVRGRRMAIPEVGPMPGRTPTRVPRIDPIRANRRFIGVKAWANPFMSWSKLNMEKFLSGFKPPKTRRERAC
jgi:hypothetical protein